MLISFTFYSLDHHDFPDCPDGVEYSAVAVYHLYSCTLPFVPEDAYKQHWTVWTCDVQNIAYYYGLSMDITFL